jgi:hypothetical protein
VKTYAKCPHGSDAPKYKNGWCKLCAAERGSNPSVREYQKQYHLDHKSDPRIKASKRKYKHKHDGIPEPTRPAPVICESCGRAPGKMGLVRDHDHGTGVFRGWLYSKCNLGIGLFGDSVDALTRAREYLLRAELA